MNKDDIDNLQIILNLSEQQFSSWFDTASEDDRDYTLELLALATASLYEYADGEIPTVDLSDASDALKKYMLDN